MMRRIVTLGICVSVVAVVSACGNRNILPNRNAKSTFVYEGVEFRSKAAKVGDDRSHFSAEIRGASRSPAGALEAGRHAGTKYCIEQYGTSNIEWVRGPDIEQENVVIVDDRLTVEGFCRI